MSPYWVVDIIPWGIGKGCKGQKEEGKIQVNDMGGFVQRAVDAGTTTATADGSSGGSIKFIEFMRDATEEDKIWLKTKLDSTYFSFTESAESHGKKGYDEKYKAYDCWAEQEGYDDLPDGCAHGVCKGMMASAILEGLAQNIINGFTDDTYTCRTAVHVQTFTGCYNVVKRGETAKSGKHSLSLVQLYFALKIVHTDKDLHCWGAEKTVWTGPTNNSVNNYKLSDFDWKKVLTFKLNINKKSVLNTKNSVFEPIAVQRCSCLPKLLCGNSAAATEIKEEDAKHVSQSIDVRSGCAESAVADELPLASCADSAEGDEDTGVKSYKN